MTLDSPRRGMPTGPVDRRGPPTCFLGEPPTTRPPRAPRATHTLPSRLARLRHQSAPFHRHACRAAPSPWPQTAPEPAGVNPSSFTASRSQSYSPARLMSCSPSSAAQCADRSAYYLPSASAPNRSNILTVSASPVAQAKCKGLLTRQTCFRLHLYRPLGHAIT